MTAKVFHKILIFFLVMAKRECHVFPILRCHGLCSGVGLKTPQVSGNQVVHFTNLVIFKPCDFELK